jgi:hypothetical protein
MRFSRWTKEEDDLLRKYRAMGWPSYRIAEAGVIPGRDRQAITDRWNYMNRSSEDKRAKLDRANALRRARMGWTKRSYHIPAAFVPMDIPAELLRDRDARINTPITVTAMLCGDPPPGWSSLDRKRQGLPV